MPIEPYLKYPAAFLAAFVVTCVLTPLFIRLAPRFRLMDVPRHRHEHARSTPRGGGIAVFAGFHAGCACVFLVPWAPFGSQVDVAWWFRFGVVSVFLAALGLVDDRWDLRPLHKLLGQVAAAVLAYALDMRVAALFGWHLPAGVDLLLTVLWIVSIVNAFNLADGMDGVATGLAVVGAAGMALSFFMRRLPGDVLVMLALIGSSLAFLRYNFSPARVFLGDTGSMFLGLTIAVMSLSTESKGATAASVLLPFFAAGVPLFDTLLAVWRRTVRQLGKRSHDEGAFLAASIARGDTEHLHHRLASTGMSHARAAVVLYAMSGLVTLLGILLTVFRSHTLGISLAAFVLGVYIMVRHIARVELWATGAAILEGLRRPPARVLSVILYPVADVAILALGSAGALLLQHPVSSRGGLKEQWLLEAALWVGIPFASLAAGRAYRRVWGRARSSEYVSLAVMLAGGILLAGGAYALMYRAGPMQLARRILLFGGMTTPVILGIRAVGQTVQDAMSWAARRPSPGRKHRRVLLDGAGYRCLLFLRGLSYEPIEEQQRQVIVGLLDEDSNLHGRFVYGHEVLGGEAQLPEVAARHRVDEILVTRDLTPESRARLTVCARELRLRLVEWKPQCTVLSDPGGGG